MVTFLNVLLVTYIMFFFLLLYLTILRLPPHRFHCAGGCWGFEPRTVSCDLGICRQTLSDKILWLNPTKITFLAYFYLFLRIYRTIYNRCLHNICGAVIHLSILHLEKFRNVHFFLHCKYVQYTILTWRLEKIFRKSGIWLRHIMYATPLPNILFAVRWIFRAWRPGVCQINKYRNRHFIAKTTFVSRSDTNLLFNTNESRVPITLSGSS